MITQHIKFNRLRKFGTEFEYNSPDNYALADTFRRINEPVHVTTYNHTSGSEPSNWTCKTDNSCGYEVSSKVLSGPRDIRLVGKVLASLKEDGARFDNRCGQHIHVETSDFTHDQKMNLLMYWIKIENFVLNAEKAHRRNNSYCRKANDVISNFQPNLCYEPSRVWEHYAGNRGAINFGNRVTTEFRFGSMTDDPDEIKNRIRFLVWFVDICKLMPPPPNLNWLTPKQVMRFMGLWSDNKDKVQKTFSPAVSSMQSWILKQFALNAPSEHYDRDIKIVTEMIKEIESNEGQGGALQVSESFEE